MIELEYHTSSGSRAALAKLILRRATRLTIKIGIP